jgi:hypothetical protein
MIREEARRAKEREERIGQSDAGFSLDSNYILVGAAVFSSDAEFYQIVPPSIYTIKKPQVDEGNKPSI